MGPGEGAVPLPRNKLVPSPVPKYTKMAIHRDSPVYSHFITLGHSPVYSLNPNYICLENSRQIAIVDYLFYMNFHGNIVLLLDIYRENLCTEAYKYITHRS